MSAALDDMESLLPEDEGMKPLSGDEDEGEPLDTETDYADREHLEEPLRKLYTRIIKGWEDRRDQIDGIRRYWDCYNCILNENQAYSGESQNYIPLVRDAVEALTQRSSAMLFPENGRFTDCTSETGDNPKATMALLDHYLDLNQAAVQVPGILRAGTVTGTRCIGVEWKRDRVRRIELQKPSFSFMGMMKSVFMGRNSPKPTMVEKDMGYPSFFAIATDELLILPANVDRIQDAEWVVETLRASEQWIDDRKRDGTFDEEMAEQLIQKLSSQAGKDRQSPNAKKQRTEDAGIKDGGKYVLLYRAWGHLPLESEDADPEPALVYFSAPKNGVICCKRNPYWYGEAPVLVSPEIKIPGSVWGKSRIDSVENLQYMGNDAANMGQDSAKRSLLQIILTDPEKNPRYGSMVQAPGAVWEAAPGTTAPLEMPDLWQRAMEVVAWCKGQIMESMGLNAAMVPSSGGSKKSQAMVAQEQQVALMQVNDEITRFEREILDPMLEWFYELDQQFRDEDLMVRVYGDLGRVSRMEKLTPAQEHRRYFFRWRGTKAFQGAQKTQQKIAMMNVLRGIPPQQMGGRQLDVGPILDQITEETFGPETARRVLIDPREQLTVDPETENEMLLSGIPVHVHPADDDAEHLQAHAQVASQDPSGYAQVHIQMHQSQMQAKNMQKAQQAAKGNQGVPGGAGPGVAGTPRPGGQATGPHNQVNPPGSIHPDQMSDMLMPRRM